MSPREDASTSRVIAVIVGYDDCVDLTRLHSQDTQTTRELFPAEARIDQNEGVARRQED